MQFQTQRNRAFFGATTLSLICSAGVCLAQPAATLTPVPPAGAPGSWKPTLGSILKITQSTNTIGYNFRCGTTVSWTGVYNPPIGADSATFTIDWDESEVTVDSNWQLRVLLGGGTVTNMPTSIESLMPGGTLDGTLTVTTPCPADVNCDGVLDNGDISQNTINFLAGDPSADYNGDGFLDNGDLNAFVQLFLAGCASPVTIAGATSLAIAMESGTLWATHFPGGYLSGATPILVGKIGSAIVLPVNDDILESSIRSAYGSHVAAVIEVESNELSDAIAPLALLADIIAVDANANEIDRISGVVVSRVGGGNGTPLIYSSDLGKPIVIVSQQLGYAPLIVKPLVGAEGGTIVVIAR